MAARAAAAAALLVSAMAARGGAQHAAPGWTIGIRATIDSGAGIEPRIVAIREQFTDRYMREEAASNGAVGVSKLETIIDTRDSSLTVLSPRRRTATLMPFNSTGLVPRVLTRSLTSTLTDLGDGGSILGHETRHFRRVVHGTVLETVEGQPCPLHLDDEREYWIAPAVNVTQPVIAMLRRVLPDAADRIAQDTMLLQPKLPAGAVLRTVIRTRSPAARGQLARTVTRTIEYTELARAPIPDSVFAIPADYRRMDVRGVARTSATRMADSLARARTRAIIARMCAERR